MFYPRILLCRECLWTGTSPGHFWSPSRLSHGHLPEAGHELQTKLNMMQGGGSLAKNQPEASPRAGVILVHISIISIYRHTVSRFHIWTHKSIFFKKGKWHVQTVGQQRWQLWSYSPSFFYLWDCRPPSSAGEQVSRDSVLVTRWQSTAGGVWCTQCSVCLL